LNIHLHVPITHCYNLKQKNTVNIAQPFPMHQDSIQIGRHDIAEILLKVTLNTKNPINHQSIQIVNMIE